MKNLFRLILMIIMLPINLSMPIIYDYFKNSSAKYKKSIMILLLFVFSISSVSAVLTDATVYYSFDDGDLSSGNPQDLSGNSNHGTNNGATTGVAGILKQQFDYDTVGDYVDTNLNTLDTADGTIAFWFTPDNAAANEWVVADRVAGNYFNLFMQSNKLEYTINDGSSHNIVGSTTLVTGTPYYVVASWGSNGMEFWINNVSQGTDAFTGSWTSANTMQMGRAQFLPASNTFNGKIDEFVAYPNQKNAAERTALYNGGAGFNPFSPSAVVTINKPSDLSFHNTTSITLNITTDLTTNLSYSLNAASNVTLCNNCNSSTNISITAILGNNQIIVYSDLNGELTSATSNFTVDTTNPSLTVNLPTEYNFYSGFNFSNYINFSDTNIDTCIVTISGESSTTCSQTNYNFTINGNHTINITATDLAGNTNSSLNNNILINPFQFFRFIDDLGNNVTNYTFANLNFTDLASVPIYNIGLGNQSLAFEKDGYLTSNFPVTFNTTSAINTTFNVLVSRILINVFNQLTGDLLTTQTLNLDLIGPTTLFTNSTTGTFNLSSFLIAGPYQVFVTTTNFQAVQNNFIFVGTEIKQIDLYMLPTNTSLVGFVNVITYQDDNTFFPEIPVTALEWDSITNTFIQTYEIFSNTNGLAVIPVILNDKIYKFCADYPNGLTCFPTSILGVTISTSQNGETFPILPERDFPKVPLLEGALEVTIDTLNLTNLSDSFYNYEVEYSWTNTLGLVSTVCTRIEKDFNFSTTSVVDTCSSSSNGIFANNFVLSKNFSYIFSIYSLEGVVEKEQFRENILGTNSFFTFAISFNIMKILQVLLVVVMVGIIPFIKIPLLIFVDLIAAYIVAWKYLIPQDLSIISVGVMIIMCGITLWVVSKK